MGTYYQDSPQRNRNADAQAPFESHIPNKYIDLIFSEYVLYAWAWVGLTPSCARPATAPCPCYFYTF